MLPHRPEAVVLSESVLLVEFEVPGKCEPQGSTTAFVPLDKRGYPLARGGRRSDGSYRHGSVIVNITSDNPALKRWRKGVAAAAVSVWKQPVLKDVSLMLELDFYLKRPEGHWGTGRNAHLLKDSAPAAPLVVPDVDKITRAIFDALTGVVYSDDSRVTLGIMEKRYAVPSVEGDGVGVRVAVYRRAMQSACDLPVEQRERWVPGLPASLPL